MKWNATAFAAALLVACAAGGQQGQAQMSPPVVEGAIVAVMPDPAAREGLSGCCSTQFKVGRSGKIRDISTECTLPLFRDAAVSAIREAGYTPQDSGYRYHLVAAITDRRLRTVWRGRHLPVG